MGKKSLPFSDPCRLADVLALIQVLSLDDDTYRSEKGLSDELQGKPASAEKWSEIAAQHPEFFRVKAEGTHIVSLVARHVTAENEEGRRVVPTEFVGELIRAAIELHDRQLDRAQLWRAYVPIVVAVTAGVFTVFGILLESWLSNGGT